jgi:cell division inhibitor SulA
MAVPVHQSPFETDLFTSVPATPAPRVQRISEFVFPAGIRDQGRALPLSLVLTMLGHLSHSADSRWLSCIGLPHTSKRECLQAGLDWQRFLQVFPSSRIAMLDLVERVLQAGRSHTVVCWLPAELSERDLMRLENAAAAGNCQGILIRHR